MLQQECVLYVRPLVEFSLSVELVKNVENVHLVIKNLIYSVSLKKNPNIFKHFLFSKSMAEDSKEETIYDRVSKLEDEIATLRNEVDVIKNAFRNELARHEVKMIKKGQDVSSIIDN